MNNETLRKAQLKYTYELIAFDPGNAGYGVSESPIFKTFSGGTCSRTPQYNSCIRDWQSACFSNNRVLSVQLQKYSMPRQNEWWYQVWIKQKFEHQRIQNETKLPLRKSLSQKVMIRSLRESRIWILVRIMNQKRQESWISRFKWFRFYPQLYFIYACKKLPDSGNQLLRTPFTRPNGAFLRGLPLKVEGVMIALTVDVSSFWRLTVIK